MDKFDVLKTWPIQAWEWPKPVVYIPLPQALPYADEVMPAFLEIARNGVPFLYEPYGFADRMRNFAARDFLKTSYTHLIMLDSDHIHPPDIVQRLCYWILDDPGRKIVAGLNFKRNAPYSPCAFISQDDGIYRLHEWPDLLLEVEAVGFGSVMIAREVFERVEEPWFFHDYSGAKGDPDFKFPGHDLDFCRRAREQGIDIWCDPKLQSPHMTASRVTERTYRTFCSMAEDLKIKETLANGASRK